MQGSGTVYFGDMVDVIQSGVPKSIQLVFGVQDSYEIFRHTRPLLQLTPKRGGAMGHKNAKIELISQEMVVKFSNYAELQSSIFGNTHLKNICHMTFLTPKKKLGSFFKEWQWNTIIMKMFVITPLVILQYFIVVFFRGLSSLLVNFNEI